MSEEEAATVGHGHQDVKNSRKLVLASAHYILDFARTKELHRALLRQNNFHRYHFQSTTKVALLDPLLCQYVTKTGDPHFIAGKDKFEAQQINLIKRLAFKRRDKAISASEANASIKSMHEGRNARTRTVETSQNSSIARQLSVDDSVQEIITGALEKAIRLHSDKDDESKSKKEVSPTEILRSKLKMFLSSKSEKDLPKMVCEVLHGFLIAISMRMPAMTTDIHNEGQKAQILRDHEKWWVSTGKSLRALLPEVFGDPNVQSLQKRIQYQLFALICTATGALPSTMIRSAAILTVTILTLHTEASLTDLCFTSYNSCSKISPILNVIIECLPFNCGTRGRNSVTFIFHCALMLHSASETVLDVLVESRDDAEILETQGTRRAFQTVCREKLNSLFVFMQWIMCFPWRLFEDRKRKPRLAAHPHQSSALVNQVSKVLVFLGHQEFQDQVIARILGVEIRCGWGNEDAIHRLFEQLERAGKCNKSMLRGVIHLLATKGNDTACSLGWIQNALVRFARDRTWCQPPTESQ